MGELCVNSNPSITMYDPAIVQRYVLVCVFVTAPSALKVIGARAVPTELNVMLAVFV
jgi:hypothetical protein